MRTSTHTEREVQKTNKRRKLDEVEDDDEDIVLVNSNKRKPAKSAIPSTPVPKTKPSTPKTPQTTQLETQTEHTYDFDDESDDEAGGAVHNISDEEFEKLISEVVRLALFSDLAKTSIKRADISNLVIKKYKNKKLFDSVFEKAKAVLENVFGYQLIALPKINKVTFEYDSFVQGQFMLVLKDDIANYMKPINKYFTNKEALSMEVIMFVLGVVFSSNHVIEDGKLIDAINSQSGLAINAKVVVSDMAKQHYLVALTEKHPESNKTVTSYRIGPRALREIGLPTIFNYVLKISDIPEETSIMNELLQTQAKFDEMHHNGMGKRVQPAATNSDSE